MDSFCEQLVKTKSTPKQKALKIIFIFSILMISMIIFVYVATKLGLMMGFVIAGVFIFFGLYLFNNMNYEFEYIFTNGELDIDKIIAQRKRKRVITVDIKAVSNFGKASTLSKEKNDFSKILAHDGIPENIYFADFKSTKYGHARLLFSPNDKVLKNMKPFLPRNLKLKENEQNIQNIPKCPICGSTNIHKISNTNKLFSILTFGIYAVVHVGKTWKCDNCGSKF